VTTTDRETAAASTVEEAAVACAKLDQLMMGGLVAVSPGWSCGGALLLAEGDMRNPGVPPPDGAGAGDVLNIRHLTDVSHCKLHQYLCCNREIKCQQTWTGSPRGWPRG